MNVKVTWNKHTHGFQILFEEGTRSIVSQINISEEKAIELYHKLRLWLKTRNLIDGEKTNGEK